MSKKVKIITDFTPDVLLLTPAIAISNEETLYSLQFYFLCFHIALVVRK